MDNTVQRIIDLVHRRDDLVAERKKATESLDREIARIESQLSALGGAPAPSTTAVATQTTLLPQSGETIKVKAGTQAAKLISILAENPSASFDYLVKAVYGKDDDTTRHNLRSVMWNLKKTNRLPYQVARQAEEENDAA